MKSYGLINHMNNIKSISQEQDVTEIVNQFEKSITEQSLLHSSEMNKVYQTLCHKNTIRVV